MEPEYEDLRCRGCGGLLVCKCPPASNLTVFVYTDDIDNTSAAAIRDALDGIGFNVENVRVQPAIGDENEKPPPLVTDGGHIYRHITNCCR